MRKIQLFCEQFGTELRSSSFVRLLLPLMYPTNASVFELSRSNEYQRADINIVERTWVQDPKKATELVARIKHDGACLIYSIDDDLLSLGRKGPLQNESMTRRKMDVIELFARQADAILVSTDRLKEKMLFYNNTVLTVPNAIDERVMDDKSICTRQPSDGSRIVVGYMGTSTHEADLAMVREPLCRALEKYKGQLELQLIGVVSRPESLTAFEGLPFRVLRSGDATDYPCFMRWMSENVQWDFAIAPLQNNEFNRCKSDIKFLDYSAIGIPGIYSRMPTYEDSVSHLETGYLAENSSAAWEKAIDYMVLNGPGRNDLAQRAKNYVMVKRTLQQNAVNWREAIISIAERRSGAVASNERLFELQYDRFVNRIYRAVCRVVPKDGTVIVIGEGASRLQDLGFRSVREFPSRTGPLRAACMPADSHIAISHLEELRAQGGEYLLLSVTANWWLDYSAKFMKYIENRYRILAREDSCVIYSLE